MPHDAHVLTQHCAAHRPVCTRGLGVPRGACFNSVLHGTTVRTDSRLSTELLPGQLLGVWHSSKDWPNTRLKRWALRGKALSASSSY
jgi:hypothetical protein